MTIIPSKTFSIFANGTAMGSYTGATPEAAVQAYAKDAGYASYADLAEVTGDPSDWTRVLSVRDDDDAQVLYIAVQSCCDTLFGSVLVSADTDVEAIGPAIVADVAEWIDHEERPTRLDTTANASDIGDGIGVWRLTPAAFERFSLSGGDAEAEDTQSGGMLVRDKAWETTRTLWVTARLDGSLDDDTDLIDDDVVVEAESPEALEDLASSLASAMEKRLDAREDRDGFYTIMVIDYTTDENGRDLADYGYHVDTNDY